MNCFRIVHSANEAVEQLNRLRKVMVTEKRNADGTTVYDVDGKEYSERELITMANSVVNDGPPPR